MSWPPTTSSSISAPRRLLSTLASRVFLFFCSECCVSCRFALSSSIWRASNLSQCCSGKAWLRISGWGCTLLSSPSHSCWSLVSASECLAFSSTNLKRQRASRKWRKSTGRWPHEWGVDERVALSSLLCSPASSQSTWLHLGKLWEQESIGVGLRAQGLLSQSIWFASKCSLLSSWVRLDSSYSAAVARDGCVFWFWLECIVTCGTSQLDWVSESTNLRIISWLTKSMASVSAIFILAFFFSLLLLICLIWVLILCIYTRASSPPKVVPESPSISQSNQPTVEMMSSVRTGSIQLERQFSSISVYPLRDPRDTQSVSSEEEGTTAISIPIRF